MHRHGEDHRECAGPRRQDADPGSGHGHADDGRGSCDGHDHGPQLVHSHTDESTSPRRLVVVIGITGTIFLAEVIGGLVSGSLALLADAGHMLTDAAGLLLALIALLIGRRPSSDNATFGHRRAEVLVAIVNAASVLAIGVYIAWRAIARLGGPVEVEAGVMMIVAVVGLVANGIAAWLLADSARGNVNLRGAYLHVLADLAGSVAVIVAGGVILWTGWHPIDSIVSLGIAAIIVPRSAKLLLTCIDILMERTPQGVDAAAVRETILAVEHVEDVHDLHIWSISGSEVLLTAHVVTDETGCAALDGVQRALEREHGIGHSTIQIEEHGHAAHESAVHP